MNDFFITGASGVVGSALVPVLLERFDKKIYMLVRARDEEHLQQRFAQLLKYWDFQDPQKATRIVPCLGDMTREHLGMQPSCYARVAGQCSSIIHCGGVVRMNLPLDEARQASISPAKAIVALARELQQGAGLHKLEYISTVGVIGRLHQPLTEVFVNGERTFHNTYEQAKAEAEEYLAAEMNNLPLTIHRPSMVVGDSGSGRNINFQVFYHLCEFLSGRRTFGVLPDFGDAVLDIVPSDYVAEIIAWSVGEPRLAGQILHACSGPSLALKVSELENHLRQYPYFARGRRLLGKHNLHIHPVLFKLFIRIATLTGAGRESGAVKALPHFLAYLSDPQIFDDTRTRQALEKIPIPKPHPADYLPVILRYYLESRQEQATKG
jgi:thioester reductase-like protein